MGEIVRLRWAERPFVQTEILAILQREVGERSSQDMVERAALELSDRLWLIEQALFEEDRQKIEQLSASMVKIARQIGLSELAQIAQDLSFICASANMPTICAIAARLQRSGEASLQFAVQYQQSVP